MTATVAADGSGVVLMVEEQATEPTVLREQTTADVEVVTL